MALERLPHGGALNAAIAQYGGRRGDWLDLSTGISPLSWPVPVVPESVWQRLPEEDDGLLAAAAACYGCLPERLLPVPGSQHAIRLLPELATAGEVALPCWGYAEHAVAWSRAGHTCLTYGGLDGGIGELGELLASRPGLRHAVVINPGNPLGTRYSPQELLPLAAELADRGGYLLVDEAFIDLEPAQSLAGAAANGVVVLRSIGKFYGLAGLRLGFVVAAPSLLAELAARTNPWAVSHPARWVGAGALQDVDWQQRQRRRLRGLSTQWLDGVAGLWPGLAFRSAGLFISALVDGPQALALEAAAAREAVLLRIYGPRRDTAVLRLGLPPPGSLEMALERLRRASVLSG